MSRYQRASRIQGTRCTIEGPGGSFCDAESAPGSPFPICSDHAIELYGWMHGMVTQVQGDVRGHLDIYGTVVSGIADDRHAKANSPQHQVYYVRIGDLIKVGITAQLRQRLGNYPPDSELLATERGGEALETRRLNQFRHLLAHRKEWFHPGEDLMAHIATLNAP